jgi:phosphoadenosine phosphosulfate reductase
MRWLEAGVAADDGLRAVDLDGLEDLIAEGSNQRLAVTVGGEAEPARLKPAFDHLARITVRFGGFKDGRGFSLGSILREAGYRGELIAAGDLIPDHAPMLARCGFDAVELAPGASVDDWQRQLESFDAAYQPAADHVATVWARRHSPQFSSSLAPLAGASGVEDPASAPLNAANPEGAQLPERFAAGSSTTPARADVAKDDDEKRELVATLNAEFRDAPADVIVRAALDRFPNRVAVLSSFGAEAAVGLHLVAVEDPSTPVLFLDTDRHFVPTLDYRESLSARLGLTDVRVLTPRDAPAHDPKGDLWRSNPDACCNLRKVLPLAAVRPDFDVLITGRKRLHGGSRLRLPVFELVDGQIRVNPMANWSGDQIEAYFAEHALPKHPLTEGGYRSIGCWPCTQPSSDDEDARAGRWQGVDKTECGIHMPSRWVAEEIRRRAS